MPVKIYFNEKPLFLCESISNEIRPYVQQNNVQLFDTLPAAQDIRAVIQELSSNPAGAAILVYPDLQSLKEAVWQQFTPIQAAGGLVRNEKGEILCMIRKGKWDLPKGKLDPGETLEACAVREVAEETGLQQLTLQHHLLTTFHTYFEKGVHILKESYWYGMKSNSDQQLLPQTSEDITEVKWISPEALQEVLDNTFASIKDVLEKAGLLQPGERPVM